MSYGNRFHDSPTKGCMSSIKTDHANIKSRKKAKASISGSGPVEKGTAVLSAKVALERKQIDPSHTDPCLHAGLFARNSMVWYQGPQSTIVVKII